MTLTDCVDPVLRNLQLSVSLNVSAPEAATKAGSHQHETAPTSNEPAAIDNKSAAAEEEGGSVAYRGPAQGTSPKGKSYPGAGGSHSAEEAPAQMGGLMLGSEAGYESDPEEWDPEDADSCDDLDFMAERGGANAGEQYSAECAGVQPVTWDHVSPLILETFGRGRWISCEKIFRDIIFPRIFEQRRVYIVTGSKVLRALSHRVS